MSQLQNFETRIANMSKLFCDCKNYPELNN